jgi:drug/metabolite transporter (DMT)-like permease
VLEALLNSLASSLNGIFGGWSSRHLHPAQVLVVASPVSALVGLCLLLSSPTSPTMSGVTIGLVAGLSGGIGIYFAYRALAKGPIGPVTAIMACTGAALISTVGIAERGSVGPLHLLALSLCFLAVVTVSVRKTEHAVAASTLSIALAAGVIGGSFSILMNLTTPADGWWPLFMVRLGVVLFTLPFALLVLRAQHRRENPVPMWVWFAAAGAGLMDGLGNMFLILALERIDLATLALFAAASPALSALLGFVLLREPISKIQALGVGVAGLGIWIAYL